MEQPRARLLRTYSGLRGGLGRGGPGAASAAAARRAGLRRLPPPAPWISPPVDRRHLFSSSCSSSLSFEEAAASSSFGDLSYLPPKAAQEKAPAAPPSSSEDSDFLPPTRKARLRKKPPSKKGTAKKKGKGAKENKAPQGELGGRPAANNTFVPPTPLRRNITQRRRKPVQRGLRIRFPLLSSTPELAKRDLEEEGGEEGVLQGSSPVTYTCCFHPDDLQEVLREDCCRGGGGDGLSELSSMKMDGDAREMGGSLELFTLEDVPSLQRKSVHEDSQAEPLPVTLFQPHCSSSPHPLFKSSSALQSCNSCSETGASLQNREGLTISPGCYVVSPSQSPGADHGQSLPVSPKEPLSGVFQLQANLHDDKIYLCLPKDAAPLANKRQRVSVQACTSSPKALGELNGAVSEEGNDNIKDYSSPQLQPTVLLDSRVVPNWLASQSTKKQAVVQLSWKKQHTLQSDSLCGLSDTSRKLVPTCSTVGTGRKACISGFSTSRWGQRGKLEKARQKRNLGRKRQADPSLLQECLKRNKTEDYLSPSILSPECSFKNSSLWRRIRASFSLHKKKIILSEVESLSGSIANASLPSVTETPKTPFTQKLSYSISPSSSMVLLSSMTSSAMSEMVLTDEEKVYRECHQNGPISFEECITPDKMQKCEKIGEGVFGEVFRTEGERGLTALKIIPIEGSDQVNGEPQKTFGEILPEIIISKELSLLADEELHQTSGFISLHSIHCVQGSYPDHLLAAWDEYHRLRVSENDRPDFFGDRQLFVVLEFEYGGMDLEYMQNRQLNSVLASKSILHQVTASLAVAEEALHFEHRDLHWGNVLVKKTTLKKVSFRLNGETRTLPTHGILVNIIDYTFSRLERDGLIVYCDLSADEEIFQGRGDYQFDIYRQMREENANSWADYFPHSNVLWLHYLADKLLKEVSYKRKPATSSLKQAQKQLKLFCEEVLSFKSATDLLNTSNFFQ
ncbi:serine/threonine-protein kinase haspin [Podarcis raffonei]|uniref:serine/threonine-protein kinase haspin n=1 Tax=Podarcis raffonei TaxID=65483 RepID=UPI00232948B1|nr:serine/threonine-protein kinase haspin [Podarcis raffonei]